jgi:hypothetical protein
MLVIYVAETLLKISNTSWLFSHEGVALLLHSPNNHGKLGTVAEDVSKGCECVKARECLKRSALVGHCFAVSTWANKKAKALSAGLS